MEDARNSIPNRYFVESAAYLLRETFEGAPEGQPSAILDRGVGLFATIEALTGLEASHESRGTTVAAQTEHAKFYLDRLCEYMKGRTEPVNWEASWLIETVNDEEWAALQASVRKAYANTLICLAEERDWTEAHIGMAMGMIAHTAYHLGVIRHLAKSGLSLDELDPMHGL